jgi:hypothetical protein
MSEREAFVRQLVPVARLRTHGNLEVNSYILYQPVDRPINL